jgi:DNA-binding NarL/FixJ family response regulator
VTSEQSGPIRVFLVDDQQMVRAGFRMLVDSQEDMEVVGDAGDGAEALERLAVTAADVVLMDVRMPRVDGVEATRRLLERDRPPRVIVLTTFDLDEYASPRSARVPRPSCSRTPRRPTSSARSGP